MTWNLHSIDWKYKDITEKIIGAAMKVHDILCNGFPEVNYQSAFTLQQQEDRLHFVQECNGSVYYVKQKTGERRIDLLTEEKIGIEFNAITNLYTAHFTQTKNYSEAFNSELHYSSTWIILVFNTDDV